MAVPDSLDEQKEQLIASYLNLYLFQNVWNESYRSLRNNVLPQRLTKRAVKGNITVYGDILDLPNRVDPFYIFAVSRTALSGLMWPKNLEHKWIDTATLVNEHGILLDSYHVHGKMLTKKDVHVYKLYNYYGFLIAINKKMFNKIYDTTEVDQIRFTIYFDYDTANQMTVKCWDVDPLDKTYGSRWEIWQTYQEWSTVAVEERRPALLLFVNGEEISSLPGAGAIPPGSTVMMTLDRNVYVEHEIDLTNATENAQFFSDIDKCYKQIVHIPRTKNPDNLIMTHNAFEIYVRKKVPEEDGTIKGLYLHRCADRSVTQITHQDIGIPVYILDAFRDCLGTSEITLRVYWRKHEDANVLTRDKNYIDLLYQLQHHDNLIVGYLSGAYKYSSDLPFWKAEHLEKSEYVRMMFDVPDVVTPANMHQYVEALGYYNTMFLLSKHVHEVIITDIFNKGYLFEKPLVYQGQPVQALVYSDGAKVPYKQVRVNNSSDTHVAVSVEEAWTPLGAKLQVEFHRDGIQAIYKIEPTESNTRITIPNTEYDLIERVTANQVVEKFDYTSEYGYVPFGQEIGHVVKRKNADNTLTLTFGPTMYGRTFYIQPKPRVLYWSSENLHDGVGIQFKMDEMAPLFFTLTKPVKFEAQNNETVFCQTGERCPIWDLDSLMVYVNGRYLIKDIDYTIQDALDAYDHVAIRVLVIQNYSYLKSGEPNFLEVYSTSATDESREIGYCAPRYVVQAEGATRDPWEDHRVQIAAVIQNNKTVLYNAGTSIVHVNGYATEAVIQGNWITKKPTWKRDWETSNPIEVRTTVPYFLSEYLKRYHTNDDIERIEAINRIYFNADYRKIDVELLDQSHYLYSIYAATVLRDVLKQKNVTLSFDPDIERMHQQLKKYKYLAVADLVYQQLVDLQYVDTFPHYLQLAAPDAEMYKLLHALIRATLPADAISNKRDVDLYHP